ncbi:MAG TPA: RNA 2',3'-cyclic phosphodiesterase [Solirubrobacteraceae bacterium]|nr:RNA 2',3'-cyclic phosphodiesterase [Solirubrobacteraceae bacterium]
MSRGATARLFVAIDPPPTVAEELVAWARRVASAMRARTGARDAPRLPVPFRVLDADSLHLTLCFLGARPAGEIEVLADALATCAQRSFELSVGAPLWLPARRPRSLAVEVHDRSGELERVHERVTATLRGVCTWQPERRRYRPHITLARVRHGAGRPQRRAGRQDEGGEQPLAATPQLAFHAPAIVLYRSLLAPEGASYQALASCELGAR